MASVVRPASGVVPPTSPLKTSLPGEVTASAAGPLTVEPKVMSPLPGPLTSSAVVVLIVAAPL